MTKLSEFITPIYANNTNNNLNYKKLKIEDVKQPIQGDLFAKFEKIRRSNEKVDNLWTLSVDHKEGDRSARDFTLAKELKGEGFTLAEIAVILWNYSHGKVSSVKNPIREVIRCYERSGNDFVGVDQETIDRIAAQVNPLRAAKEAAKQITYSKSSLITGDKVDYRKNSIPLVKGLIDRNTTNLLFGPSTGGKSFLMIDMGISLAKGYAFWDQYRIHEKCGVLIVNGEGGGGYHKRVEVAMRKHGIIDRAPRNFPFGFVTGYYNLYDNDETAQKSRQKIVDAVRELEKLSGYKVRLIVYDTMSKMLGSGNESEAKDVRVFQGNVEKIAAQCDVASLIVHHIGKDEASGARGSYALLSDMDAQLQLTVKSTGNQRVHYLSSPKQKDHADGKVTAFKLNVMEIDKDDDGDPIDSCFVVLKSDKNAELFPSIEHELDFNTKCALHAIRFYHSIPETEKLEIRYTQKQIKAILFNDFKENNKVFSENQAAAILSKLDVMAKPDRTVLRAFERCCDTLATKGLTKENVKYQLVNQDCDTYDRGAT